MRTSQATSGLSEPTENSEISIGTLGYIRARHRQRQYDLIIKEFRQSRLTQKQLADRTGKSPEVISRLLARPQNWEADTFSDLLFAIRGGIARYAVDYPLAQQAEQPPAEQVKPTSAIPMKNSSSLGTNNEAIIKALMKQSLEAVASVPA